ncbi:hypothetical protein JXA56_03740 [Candidatus Micrarchaeota archaeon]|nr:hypothetical protein [Candidatus Micrarchaeota archaeon]
MYLSTARVIRPQKDGFKEKAPEAYSFETSSRLAKLPYLEAMVLAGRAKLVHTHVSDGKCESKARATGFSMDQILTIAFFDVQTREEEKQGIAPRTYGIIRAASEKLDSKALTAFGISGAQAKRAKHTFKLPDDMKGGTCSPFMSEQAAKQVSGLVFAGKVDPERMMDVSIGGTDDTAQQYSVQMPYGEVVRLVKQQFGSAMKIVSGSGE